MKRIHLLLGAQSLILVVAVRHGPRPLILYFGSAYTAGLVVTAALTMQ